MVGMYEKNRLIVDAALLEAGISVDRYTVGRLPEEGALRCTRTGRRRSVAN